MRLIIGNVESKVIIGGVDNLLPFNLQKELKDYLSVKVDGCQYSEAYRRGQWDGKKSFITADGRFATGFVPKISKFCESKGVEIVVEDQRGEIPKLVPKNEMITHLGVWEMRDYQLEAVMSVDNYFKIGDTTIYFPRGIIDAATNAGKNSIMAGMVKNIAGAKAIMVINRIEIYKQAIEFFSRIFDIGMIDSKNYKIGEFTVAMQQSLLTRMKKSVNVRNDMSKFNVLFADECFVPNTLVDGVPIQNLVEGYSVKSFNHSTAIIEYKKIIKVGKTKVSRLAKVTFSNGINHWVTEGHPYFSASYRKYLEISKLTSTFVVSINEDEQNLEQKRMASSTLYCLWNLKRNSRGKRQKASKERKGFLFGWLSKTRESKRTKDYNRQTECVQQKVCLWKNEVQQSNEESFNEGESIRQVEGNGPQTFCERRKRVFNSSSAVIGCCIRLGDGIASAYWKRKTKRLSNLLQVGYRKFSFKDWYRGGWRKSFISADKRERQEKNIVFRKLRVESIEIHEQGSSDEFERVCPEGFVYNIEVQDNNNYFVDGILVHNCHYAGGNDYSRLTSLIPAPIRILVSGTSLDSEKMTNKLVIIGTAGGYLYQIKNKDLIKKKVSLKPIIHFIYNKCAQDGRTYDENVEDYIHKSENRLEEFKKWIISEGHINKQIVVAFAIIKHGEFMYESFKNDSRFQNLNIDWVHGTDSDRTEKIKDFKESRTNLLIASTIIQEGLNIPNIEILNYGLGGSSKIQLKQFIGRAIRDDGKSSEVLIVDFYDDCKWLDVHSRERLKIYNAEEFDIVYHYKADKLGRMSKKII